MQKFVWPFFRKFQIRVACDIINIVGTRDGTCDGTWIKFLLIVECVNSVLNDAVI